MLRLLEDEGAKSLDDLYNQLKISKTALSRILVTLQSERLASQRIADRKWVAGPGISPSNPVSAKHNLLVQAATPHLAKLCDKVIWPSDLSVRSGLKMVLVETSRPHTTLLFNKLSIGFEIDFLLSAPGRAYLAFCPYRECDQILTSLKRRADYGFLFEGGEIANILQRVREQGFGHRDMRWGGRSSELRNTHDDGLDAIAVPIFGQKGLLGCVNIIWIRSILSRNEAINRYLADLLSTADAIASAY